jgi:hypothetical protein
MTLESGWTWSMRIGHASESQVPGDANVANCFSGCGYRYDPIRFVADLSLIAWPIPANCDQPCDRIARRERTHEHSTKIAT